MARFYAGEAADTPRFNVALYYTDDTKRVVDSQSWDGVCSLLCNVDNQREIRYVSVEPVMKERAAPQIQSIPGIA